MANWWEKGRQQKDQLGQTVFSSVRAVKKRDNRSLFHYQALEPAFSDRYRAVEDDDRLDDFPVQNVSHLQRPIVAKQYGADIQRRSSWSSTDSRKIPDDPVCRHSVFLTTSHVHGIREPTSPTAAADTLYSKTVEPVTALDEECDGPTGKREEMNKEKSSTSSHSETTPKDISETSSEKMPEEIDIDNLKSEQERLQQELRRAEDDIIKLKVQRTASQRRQQRPGYISPGSGYTRRSSGDSSIASGSPVKPSPTRRIIDTPDKESRGETTSGDQRSLDDSGFGDHSLKNDGLGPLERQAIAEISEAVRGEPDENSPQKAENGDCCAEAHQGVTSTDGLPAMSSKVQLNVTLHNRRADVARVDNKVHSSKQNVDTEPVVGKTGSVAAVVQMYSASTSPKSQPDQDVVSAAPSAPIKTPDAEYHERREKALSDLERLKAKITPARFIDIMPQFDDKTGAPLPELVRERLARKEAERVARDAENSVQVALEKDKEAMVNMII